MDARTTWEQTAVDLRIKLDTAMHDRDIARKSLQKANVELEQQEKYAEFGRLAVEAVDKFDHDDIETYLCESCRYEKETCLPCVWYKFCQKRAELLAGEKPKNHKCLACNGSGYYDSHGSPKCGACDGTGITGGGACG